MQVAGVIAEYNPFHNGHALQLQHIRSLGADYVVVVMSGDFVQRGAPALVCKHARAEMALRAGVDLVLELPVSWSTASAEYFASGGVALLEGLGVVTDLYFGAETPDSDALLAAAGLFLSESPDYQRTLKEALREGLPFAAARMQAAQQAARANRNTGCGNAACVPEETLLALLSMPNNILGLEYCKALLRSGSSIRPVPLPRVGAGHHDQLMKGTRTASASALRLKLTEHPECLSDLADLLPEASIQILEPLLSRGAWLWEEDLSPLLAYCLLRETEESLSRYQDVTPALARRILRLRNEFTGFSRFADLLKTKELAYTRICRALLHVLLNLKDIPAAPSCARVLGFRRQSTPLLREITRKGNLPLVTKPAAALHEEEAAVFASNLYERLLTQKAEGYPFRHDLTRSPIIIET